MTALIQTLRAEMLHVMGFGIDVLSIFRFKILDCV